MSQRYYSGRLFRLIVVAILYWGFCPAILATAAATFQQEIWNGTSGDFSVEWNTTDIIVKQRDHLGEIVLSFRALANSEWNNLAGQVPDQSPVDGEMSYRILSIVGPFLSVEEGNYCDCGGAHPSASKHFRAIDLRHSKPDQPGPLSLTDLFPEKEVFAALASDKLVAAALSDSETPKPSSLSTLLEALEFKTVQIKDCSYYFSNNLLDNFAFYEVKEDKIAIRISLSHQSEICRGQITQIGIMLPIPEPLKIQLYAAKGRKRGFLMKDSNTISRGSSTVFKFPTKTSRK